MMGYCRMYVFEEQEAVPEEGVPVQNDLRVLLIRLQMHGFVNLLPKQSAHKRSPNLLPTWCVKSAKIELLCRDVGNECGTVRRVKAGWSGSPSNGVKAMLNFQATAQTARPSSLSQSTCRTASLSRSRYKAR